LRALASVSCRLVPSSPPSCAPFAPCPLRQFLATMGALTPVGPVLRKARTLNERQLLLPTGLPDSRFWPSHPSVSKHRVLCPRHRFITLPLSSSGFPLSRVWVSSLGCRLTEHSGRIEFVILRTGSSLPVAPHIASRRRSYFLFQAGERIPEEDFHLSDQKRFQAHSPAWKGWVSYKLNSEPGRAAHKVLMPVETLMFDILLADPLSWSATNP